MGGVIEVIFPVILQCDTLKIFLGGIVAPGLGPKTKGTHLGAFGSHSEPLLNQPKQLNEKGGTRRFGPPDRLRGIIGYI